MFPLSVPGKRINEVKLISFASSVSAIKWIIKGSVYYLGNILVCFLNPVLLGFFHLCSKGIWSISVERVVLKV